MMRNVYRYRYIVVIDFDEVIVPRSDDDYSSLVRRINNENNVTAGHPPPHAYMFHNTYFFRDLTPDTLQPAHLRTLRYRRSAPPSEIYVSFID